MIVGSCFLCQTLIAPCRCARYLLDVAAIFDISPVCMRSYNPQLLRGFLEGFLGLVVLRRTQQPGQIMQCCCPPLQAIPCCPIMLDTASDHWSVAPGVLLPGAQGASPGL